MLVECSYCRKQHELEALEPFFRRPDAFLELVQRDGIEVCEAKDACAVRAADDSWTRYFVRVLVPFTVEGLAEPISFGAWVEVSEEQSERVNELWDDPAQGDEPPFTARFANAVVNYFDTLGITGLVSLTDPVHIPTFHMLTPADHPFVSEQRNGVPVTSAAEWMIPIYHPEYPESLIQQKIRELAASRNETRRKKWWQFWR